MGQSHLERSDTGRDFQFQIREWFGFEGTLKAT